MVEPLLAEPASVAHRAETAWRSGSVGATTVVDKDADEFATALMVMVGQRDRVRAGAESFAANASVAEAMRKMFRDDRHPLSSQRARNIMRWLNDPALVRKWQPIFVPHMQSDVLRALLRQPRDWVDCQLIEKELASRP